MVVPVARNPPAAGSRSASNRKFQSGLIVDNKCGSSADDENALNQLQNAESEIEKAEVHRTWIEAHAQ